MMSRPMAEESKDTPTSGVISNLPRHRPHRRSDKRRPPGEGRPAQNGAREPRAGKAPGPQRSAPAGAQRSAAAGAQRSASTGPRAPKGAPPPRSARERIGATAGAKTRPAGPSARPRPTPPPPPAQERPGGPPSGTELLGTVVQAAGELAEIGLTLGAQAVKNAVKRLPRP